jgi:hypothetical protein
MRLTLNALEKAGIYDHPIKTWRDTPEGERIWTTFGPHFEHGENERLRLLTATNASFHGAKHGNHSGADDRDANHTPGSRGNYPNHFPVQHLPTILLLDTRPQPQPETHRNHMHPAG